MIRIADLSGQIAYVHEAYLIAVIVPSLLGGGDGKCRVVFVGGLIEVSAAEAQRVLERLERPPSAEPPSHVGGAAAAMN